MLGFVRIELPAKLRYNRTSPNLPTGTIVPTATTAASPTSTLSPLQQAKYVYDGDGSLVKSDVTAQNGTDTITYYVSGYYNVQVIGSNTTVQKFYTFGSQTVAMQTSLNGAQGTLNWIMSDNLNSTTVTANADGTFNSELRYSAFGEIRYSSGVTPTNYQYTGQLGQPAIGLDFYVARWFDPVTAHFAQADSEVANPSEPQTFDRYMYVNNNSIKYNDPTGHDAGMGVLTTEAREYLSGYSDVAPQPDQYYLQSTPISATATATPGTSVVVILICGIATNGDCGNRRPEKEYNNQVPLAPYSAWAQSNNYPVQYYEENTKTNTYTKDEVANQVVKYIESHSNDIFVIVGHSAGADAAILVGHKVGDKSKIKAMALIDPSMTASGYGTNDNGNSIQDLANDLQTDKIPVYLAVGKAESDKSIQGAKGPPAAYPLEHDPMAVDSNVANGVEKFFQGLGLGTPN